MKVAFLFLALILTAVPDLHAVQSLKMIDAMEDYARDIVRKHPELAKDQKKKDYRKSLVDEAARAGIFEISEDEEKLIRRRKEVLGKGKFEEMLTKMKELNSKDPSVVFLIEYAEQDRIKPVEKLLAYRLMQRDYNPAAQKAANNRAKHMHAVMVKYSDYKQIHGKAPASLDDLDLPEESKKFTNSKGEKVDWIYIGHLGPRLKYNDSHIVLVAPEPAGGARPCGLDNGGIVNFNNASLEPKINKLVEAMKNGTVPPNAGGQGANTAGVSSAALTEVMKRIKIFQDLNNNRLPATLNDLTIEPEHKNYTDPSSGEKHAWIYWGDKPRAKISEDVSIIILAPKPHMGKRLAGLSDGKIVTLLEEQIAPALK